MKSITEIAGEIDQLEKTHYYSEDFELVASMKAFVDACPVPEKVLVGQVVMKRLLNDCSVVDILWCYVVDVPSAVPLLADRLNREPHSSQLSRTLILALGRYKSDDGYRAVERFLDSDQEMEALDALAEIDFRRTIPVLVRAMKKEYFHRMILHVLYRHFKHFGVDKFMDDLKNSSATRNPEFLINIEKALRSKTGAYNPFSENEIRHILDCIGGE
jgi:hypothetical protein